MKIVVVAPGGFDPSGRERVIPALLWLAEHLARRHELHICVLEGAGAPGYELLGARVHVLGPLRSPPGLRVALLGRRLLAALRAIGRPDLLHGFWAGTSGLLAGLAARRLGLPAVLSIGGGELVWLPELAYGGRGTLRGRLQAALALRLASTVTAGSCYAAQPLGGRSAEIVPLGVEYGLFAAPAARAPGPPWRLLHVASINRVKDQPTLLRALRQLANCEPGVRLDWVGEDTLGGELQRMCSSLGLAKHVTFHGFVPSERVAPLYHQAHLLLHSSRHES